MRALLAAVALLPGAGSLIVLDARENDRANFDHVTAGFGPPLEAKNGVSGVVVATVPQDACKPLQDCEQCEGKILISQRGGCDFYKKVLHAQAAGALALVVANNQPGDELITMSAGPEAAAVSIPSVYVTQAVGQIIQAGAYVMLNGTSEFVVDAMDEQMAAALDPLVSPWRTKDIIPGAITDSEYLQSTQLQIMVDVLGARTTVLDNHFSTFNPNQHKCSSLDGPNCLSIKRKFANLGPETMAHSGIPGLDGQAGIEMVGPEGMAKLQAQLQAALLEQGIDPLNSNGVLPADIDLESMLGDLIKSMGTRKDQVITREEGRGRDGLGKGRGAADAPPGGDPVGGLGGDPAGDPAGDPDMPTLVDEEANEP